MKKIWIATLCSSLMFAEEPTSIEILTSTLDEGIEEIVIPASTPTSQASPEIVISTEAPPVQALEVPELSVQKIEIDPVEDIAAIEKEEREVAAEVKESGIVIDLGQVFSGSPTIYSVLFVLSIVSVGIWAYALLSLRNNELMPKDKMEELQAHLSNGSYDAALETCKSHPTLLFGMVSTAILNRHQGSAAMLELMKAEGRRLSISYWQKINLLNDIAIIAPMLGLLGTVLGMFYAFYDLNRSAESISALFDGLGISVGTTVGGLVVAIMALLFHALTKYRLTRQLIFVEAEAEALAKNIKDRS